MERLTFDGNFCDISQCRELPCSYNGSCSQRKVWERLKAYEDTHMMPADVMSMRMDMAILTGLFDGIDVDRMREIVAAERDGRVVVSCWIPVTERLPEDSVKECIIFVPHIPENIVGLGRYLGAGRWVLDGWYLTPEAVAYWMPLPEAPHKKALEAMKDV